MSEQTFTPEQVQERLEAFNAAKTVLDERKATYEAARAAHKDAKDELATAKGADASDTTLIALSDAVSARNREVRFARAHKTDAVGKFELAKMAAEDAGISTRSSKTGPTIRQEDSEEVKAKKSEIAEINAKLREQREAINAKRKAKSELVESLTKDCLLYTSPSPRDS